ncbi:MAG: hypothetical protein K6V97_03485 [Actinomycetia bacterium]|nr:hypothetical protein [Actinomycetes bacterium]
MRRPVTLLLLLLFVAAELYGLRVLPTPASGSTWERLVASPAVVVTVEGHPFLLGAQDLWELRRGSDGQWTALARPLTWIDVPEPSGAGFWRVAETPDGRPLASAGAPVFPAPHGSWVLWVDGGTRALYVSQGRTVVLQRVTPVVAVETVRWNPTGTEALVAATGPEGRGVYRWAPGTGLVWTGPAAAAPVASLDTGTPGSVVAVQVDGTVLAPGTGMNGVRLDAAWVGPGGAVLGVRSGKLVRWTGERWATIPVPGLPTAPPRFEAGTGRAAYVTRTGGRSVLVVLDGTHAATVDCPGSDAVVAGWVGSAPVVAVLDGPNAGTYRMRTATHGAGGGVATLPVGSL